jgi:Flp pilus assembly protein TadB
MAPPLAAALAGGLVGWSTVLRGARLPTRRLRSMRRDSTWAAEAARAERLARDHPRFPASAMLATGGVMAAGLLTGTALTAVLLAGVAAMGVPRLLARRRADPERHARVAALPGVVELLSACLVAGCTVVRAVGAVASAVPPPLAGELRAVGTLLDLGADVRAAWAPLAVHPESAALARAMVRSSDSGAPLVEVLDRLAADLRRDRSAAAASAARTLAVRAVGPLGVCFLPAFLLLGVFPTVWGLAGGVLGGGR